MARKTRAGSVSVKGLALPAALAARLCAHALAMDDDANGVIIDALTFHLDAMDEIAGNEQLGALLAAAAGGAS